MIVNRSDRAGGNAPLAATLGGLPLLALGWFGLISSSSELSLMGVYVAFLSALAVWGWFELAFLCGVITGPNVRECPEGVAPWERFVRAWGTIAYSEIALIASLSIILLLCWGAENPFGLYTFSILFFARISAKLNLYLGVPNINVEFLPQRLHHLASHFRIGPMNWFFPVGVTALTLCLTCWLERAISQPAGSASEIGFVLVASLTALALLEHWVMILPIPDEKLWRWMIPVTETLPHERIQKTIYLREESR